MLASSTTLPGLDTLSVPAVVCQGIRRRLQIQSLMNRVKQ